MKTLLTVALMCGVAANAAGLSIYVDQLGTDQGAPLLRDKLIGELASTEGVRVVNSRSEAHAVITGTAIAIVGDEAHVSQLGGSAGTTVISQMALQLQDARGSVLWGFNSSRCRQSLIGSAVARPINVAGCAANDLAKIIRKDHRLSDSALPETLPGSTNATPQEAARIGAEVEGALRDARAAHPDFGQYEAAIGRISHKVPPGKMTPAEYVEMLYVLAKAEEKSTF